MNDFRRAVAACAVVLLTSCAHQTSSFDDARDARRVRAIFEDLDDRSLPAGEQIRNYTDDVVLLEPDEPEVRGLDALEARLSEFGRGVDLATSHEIVELTSFDDIVVVQGKVTGTAQPDGDPNAYAFETKNIIIFKRSRDGGLKIWKVIYNAAPVS
ncbi:MAG: YybH family protein [Parvularculaceae bacterium]